ncbi:MAG: protein kinase [Candidatus Hydrogenedentes bacterium]|nr:protein kinase [Candidatus Hydrogenedentota bacterium]
MEPTFNFDGFWTNLERIYQKHGQEASFNKEHEKLQQVLQLIIDDCSGLYEIVEPIEIGGAGIIVKVRDLKVPGLVPVFRALKFPRPLVGVLTSVNHEAKNLLSVRHPHIIPVHFTAEVNVDGECYSFFVMDYIEGAQNLKSFAVEQLNRLKAKKAQIEHEPIAEARRDLLLTLDRDTNIAIMWFSSAVWAVASAVAHLHEKKLMHFDVKPSNILVDTDGKALVADLGYAKSSLDDLTDTTLVGFTEFYAHPDLLAGRYKSKGDPSGNRCERNLRKTEFKQIWDIYAFGKTILEILNTYERLVPGLPSISYHLQYLHLAACRMLDGLNRSRQELLTDRGQHTENMFYEEWFGLTAEDFRREDLKYSDFAAIQADLDKLLGYVNLELEVPELSSAFRERIQTDLAYPAPFSNRVKMLINHPCLVRTKFIPQLGLVPLVYPTATHARFEHSVGVFSFACEYVKSLWYDDQNPLFRQWISLNDVKALLVASLVHDIGHFPLAHDLEPVVEDKESFRDVFDQIRIAICLLESDIRDQQGRSLRTIIENNVWGWGVTVHQVIQILRATKTLTVDIFDASVPAKEKFLAGILSGNIDADKLDYLLRDGRACLLRYGESIDIPRLLRTLTTAIVTREDSENHGESTRRRTLEIAIYEKGKSAAEAIGFARYLMYQAVYWHHAVRGIKAMLYYVTEQIFTHDKQAKAFRTKFESIIGILPDSGTQERSKAKAKYGMHERAFDIMIQDILELLYVFTDGSGREIIELLRRRRIYKRVITVHRKPSVPGEDSRYDRIRKHRTQVASRFREEVAKQFLEKARTQGTTLSGPTRKDVEEVVELLSREHSILIDVPDPQYGGALNLCIIPELEGLKSNHEAKMHASLIMEKVWREVYAGLMESICKIRVFCHPQIREIVSNVLKYEGLNQALDASLRVT